MSDYLKELNPEQQAAVLNYEGANMVLAGAGSGKTRVLTYRIAHLIKQNIAPWSILSLTFTNKAAAEMKKRISDIVGKAHADKIWMGTFHSIFAKILRIESKSLGYSSNFTIYDTVDAKNIIKKIVKELNLDDKIYNANRIYGKISFAKNNLITAGAYYNHPELIQSDQNARQPRIADIYKIYTNRCKQADAMDFDDLLLNTNILFRDHPDVLKKYQKRFNYILVDEYQDTNYAQYLIIKYLSSQHKNVCVVGDDAQSIYSFRGAKIENILNFKNDYPEHKIFKLERNYRSTKTIVNAANSIINKNDHQITKNVWSDKATGGKIRIFSNHNDAEEGINICRDIMQSLHNDNPNYKDFAILYRTNAQSRIFEEVLRKNNIPYKLFGSISFYQRKEIKDLLAYFRFVVNKKDVESLRRIINYPTRGIGATTQERIEQYANSNKLNIWDVLSNIEKHDININSGAVNRIKAFVLLINEWTQKLKSTDAYDLAFDIASNAGIIKEFHQNNDNESLIKYENIQELLNSIKEYCDNAKTAGDSITLDKYIEEISLLTNADMEKPEDNNKVSLMTIHSAKGLEFKHLYIVGVEEELFPSQRSAASQRELEEERRLFYVALTRAEEQVTVSFAGFRYKWGVPQSCIQSRFINEIDPQYLESCDNNATEKQRIQPRNVKPFKPKKSSPIPDKKHIPLETHGKKLVNLKKAVSMEKSNVVSRNKLPEEPSGQLQIATGMQVEHARFGKGKVINISGESQDKKATVFFQAAGQKQLLLKFAKLKVLEG